MLSQVKGSPIQEASRTAVTSTLPVKAATAYDATTPSRMGMILIMPRPKMLARMTTAMATRAIHQLAWQLLMAEELRLRPMQMMTGPVTIGGKNRMTFFVPKALNSAASTTYSRPAHATPKQAYGSISALGTVISPAASGSIGAMAW